MNSFCVISRPTRERIGPWRLAVAVYLGCFALGGSARAQYLRVVAYNIEADIGGYAAPRDGLYTVLEAIGQQQYAGIQQPLDILALEETTTNGVVAPPGGTSTGTVAPIVTALNAYYGADTYAMATYQGTQRGSGSNNGNGPNAMVYNAKTVSLLEQGGVPGTPSASGGAYRQVVRYKFQPLNSPPATAFYLYVSHMKSSAGGTTAAILTARDTEAQLIRTDIAKLPAGSNVLSVGDFNLDGSTEAAYQTLTSSGPLVDPLNINPQDDTQTWTTAAYKAIMTDSSTNLSYRDDLQLMTPAIYAGTAPTGLHYVSGSCRAFGNNGSTALHASTNRTTNTALNSNFQGPITAATALAAMTTGSDHLAIVADYFVATPLATWKSHYFSVAESKLPAVSGDGADPDQDGILNLMEYALGLPPRTSGAQGLPVAGQITASGKQYLTLTYTSVIADTDISYVPQVSGDLTTWSSGPGYLASVSVTNNPGGLTQTVTVRDLVPIGADLAGQRFVRLEVVRN